MNQHTKLARTWLDRRYSRDARGQYCAHQPIYGLAGGRSEPNTVLRLARTLRLLELLDALEFQSVLDVGGGEGYLAALVRDLCGASIAHSSDLSVEACLRAREIFGIHGAAADSARLPFADNSYDLVICSEVIEHLSRPVLAIGELTRVSRKSVVITTSEFCPAGELERVLRCWTLDRSYPHAELNWFTARDFRTLLGEDVVLRSQYRNVAHIMPDRSWNRHQAETILGCLTASDSVDVDHAGVIVMFRKSGDTDGESGGTDLERRRRIFDRLFDPPAAEPVVHPGLRRPDQAMVERLRCLICRCATTLDSKGGAVTCTGCGHRYEIRDGTPVMIVDGVENRLSVSMEDECALRLAPGDRARERRVRKLMTALHGSESKRNPWWKRWSAEPLLRWLWFFRRSEPPGQKLKRLLGRFSGQPTAAEREIEALLGDLCGSTGHASVGSGAKS